MAAIHMRMLGYLVTLAMHGGNMLVMNSLLQGPVMEDPNIRTFSAMYKRFFTVWTMFLQLFVASLGLTTDYYTLKYRNKKEPQWLGVMRSVKNRIFAAVLWPTVFLVSSLFWSLYHYDRSLIYPLFADKILSSTANHILHTAVIPLVVWEVIFQPRSVPKKHGVNVTMLTVYMFAYLFLMYYTYIEQGIWMYPIFGLAYNKHICFPLIISAIGVMLFIYYHMQWFLTRIVWGSQVKIKK
ncbi:androgen-dependent TFPI-regulating protein-like [Leguminivora glycinivorella]|uniref:androgen-dependent TFPI-regulating protein-like n=1 Tax=Leguminivora glycinivorella TaxID=1035111 RepID=UPI00200CA98F|nr:androgen-dependent TFPI-regulating protein-like [Leguminivora glycinivorella]